MPANVGHGLSHLLNGELTAGNTEEELGSQSPCHGISVQDGAALFHRQALKGVAHGMAQVQGLSESVFEGVFQHNAALHLDALAHHFLQGCKVRLVDIKA